MSNQPEVQVTVTPVTAATAKAAESTQTLQSPEEIIKSWMDENPIQAIRRIVAAATPTYIKDKALCLKELDASLAAYPEHRALVEQMLEGELQISTARAQTAKEAKAIPMVSTRKAYKYKNISPIALPITELGITIPVGGYSAPILEETVTLKAFNASGMLLREEVSVDNVPNIGNSAVTQGGQTSEMQGIPAPAFAKPDVKPGIHMIAVATKKPEEMIRAYEGKAGVKDAMSNSVVAIRSGDNPNPYGEIPQDAMSSILTQQGKGFSSEISSGAYVEDAAQKIISNAVAAQGAPRQAAVVQDQHAPAELKPWLNMTGLQKKISIYKSSDAATLTQLRSYERDVNILSCLDTKLAELSTGK